ncbi:MAG: transposase [Patescibacteria group bacterium UBA2163]
MTAQRTIAPGEYYHIYNRGAFKQTLFKEHKDYARFLFYMLYAQSPIPFSHITRLTESFSTSDGFTVSPEETNDVIVNRSVELTSFCIMPNHYHLIVKEVVEGGIARYMQRVGNGYTKYFNTKYEASGRIFQNAFQAKHIADNNYLLYLSAYIHRNPRELKTWKDKIFDYPWSSLQDITEANRWGGLLEADIIAAQFEQEPDSNYRDFVETSTAKILEEELDELPKL